MSIIRTLTAGICLVLFACSTPRKLADAAYKGKSYNHLFIFANTADIGARVQFEKDLSEAAVARGYMVVKSIDIFPPAFVDPRPPTKEQIMDSLKAIGCDALLVVNLTRKEDLLYKPGVNIKANKGMIGGILASSLGYSGTNTEVKAVSKPGSYAYENGFHIKCDLADAATETIIYSNVSEMMEYEHLHTQGKAHLRRLIEQLEKK